MVSSGGEANTTDKCIPNYISIKLFSFFFRDDEKSSCETSIQYCAMCKKNCGRGTVVGMIYNF